MTDFRGVLDKTTTSEGTFWHSAGIEDRLPGYVGIPAKPTGLSATPGSNSAALSWDAVTGADSIAVYYREGTEGAFTLATDEVAGDAITYLLTGLDPETLYNWYITATNAAGTSEPSDIDDFTTTAALSSTLTITGSGFGQGPIVFYFDRFLGTDGTTITASREPDIGGYASTTSVTTGVPKIYYDPQTNRTWYAPRDPAQIDSENQLLTGLVVDLIEQRTTFRVGIRSWVPTDKKFPAATEPGVFPSASSWKVSWLGQMNEARNDLAGTTVPFRDLCFPTHIGNGNVNVSGNSGAPRYNSGSSSFYTDMSLTAPTLHTMYINGPGAHHVYDKTCELIYVNDEGSSRNVQNACDPFWSTLDDSSFNFRSYDCWKISGWFGNSSSYPDTLPLIADAYIAFGTTENPERARACVIVGNAATLAGCTEAYLIPPDSWGDTAIGVTLAEHEDFGEDTHVHLILSDGTLLQDVSFTRAE